jgi:hypothetical protein
VADEDVYGHFDVVAPLLQTPITYIF